MPAHGAEAVGRAGPDHARPPLPLPPQRLAMRVRCHRAPDALRPPIPPLVSVRLLRRIEIRNQSRVRSLRQGSHMSRQVRG